MYTHRRWQEPPLEDLQEMVKAIINAMDDLQLLSPAADGADGADEGGEKSTPPAAVGVPPPIILVGYGMGALLAYEIARQLKLDRGWDPLALVIGGCKPPHVSLLSYYVICMLVLMMCNRTTFLFITTGSTRGL